MLVMDALGGSHLGHILLRLNKNTEDILTIAGM
jgi:hypothetical protein